MNCTYRTSTDTKIYTSSKTFIEIKKTVQQGLNFFLNRLGNSNVTNLLNLDDKEESNLKFTRFMERLVPQMCC